MSSMDTQILQSQDGAQKRTCPLCNVEYSSVSSKNKHMKNIHNQQLDTNVKKTQRIICPLCTENKLICETYSKLEQHLEVNHNIKLEIETRNFATKENFELWFEKQQVETTYATVRLRKSDDFVEKTYTCNRTNSTGHRSNCSKRKEKAGGSIKIYGVCPSRLNIKIWKSGETNVKFCKSHIGHEKDIRSHRLSKLEKSEIVQKLCMGVTVDRIISDARKVTSDKVQRINILNRKDVSYLMKKHVMKNQHENDNITIKVEELNANESNELSMVHENMTKEAEINYVSNLIPNFLRSLNDEDYKMYMGQINVMLGEPNRSGVHKIKMEKQEFLPTKRRKSV